MVRASLTLRPVGVYFAVMSAETAGILLGVLSALMSAFIFWGGFVEQNRANREYRAKSQ